jgi:hypothetical protein
MMHESGCGRGDKIMPAARRVRERAVLFAKIVKIRPHIHRRTGCTLDEIVRHELAAVPVKVVAQPGVQRAEFAAGDFTRDFGMRLERGRIKLRR